MPNVRSIIPIVATSAAIVCAAAPAQKPAAKIALLIGVNDYEHKKAAGDFHDLTGCRGDVERFRRVLMRRFGFRSKDIVVLKDEQATHENIVRAFDKALIQRAGPDTEAVFFFSGHGSRLPDANPDRAGEPDGTDSTLVAFDSRNKDRPAFDLTDDELYSLLAALCDKTKRVTVITDTCHSGGVVRGERRSVKSGPEGLQPLKFDAIRSFWPKKVPFLDDLDPGRRDLPSVHFAACLKDQQAEEKWFDSLDGSRVRAGLLTWFLCEELERIEPGATYEQLIKRVARRVATRVLVSSQEPVYEGNVTREVFGGGFGSPVAGYEVRVLRGRKGREVRVFAGTLHGVNLGTVLDVKSDTDEKLGRLRLVRVRLSTSDGVWVEKPSLRANTQTHLRGHLVARGKKAPPLVVYMPRGEREDDLAARLAKLTDLPLRVVRDAAAEHQYAIRRDRRGAFRIFVGAAESVGAPVPLQDPAELAGVATKLAATLRGEVLYQNWMRLAEHSGPVPLTIRLEPLTDAEIEEYKADNPKIARVRFAEPTARGARTATRVVLDRPGVTDAAQLVVTVPDDVAEQELYLWIFSITENRAVQAIYPREDQNVGENRIKPGTDIRRGVQLLLPRDGTWKAERPMRDRYVALLTKTRIGLAGLCTKGTIVEKARAIRKHIDDPPRTRGAEDDPPLPELLELMLTGSITRGESLRSRGARERFGITSLDLLVQKAPR